MGRSVQDAGSFLLVFTISLCFRCDKRNLAPKRILLVDDFEPWRMWVRLKLAPTEFQVVGDATDGNEALQKVQDLQPDLILLDIGLPGMSGIETAERIRQMDLGCKIIFLTENRDPLLMRAGLDTGAAAYLLKIGASTQLIHALEAALN